MDERSIFLNALDKNEPQERAKYLQEACGENQPLRRRVEALLRASRDAGEFLESPPAALVATIASGAFDAKPVTQDEISLDFLAPCDKPGCLGRLAQYEVVEVVGRGGMGLVLRAFDSKLNRVVAIKVMAPELAANPMAVKRFLREARAAAAVCHDHVVTIHSIHDTQRPPFLVMEFVDGQSLQQKIDRVGALELQEILRIGIQTASGLAAAHKQGLVHRDIKPANILLENGVERVKITDFGLARMNDDVGVTQTGQIAGTPQYMSPEQAQGQPVDARSDLFSLGSVLYTMCAGRPPFRGDSAVAMLRRVCDDDPRPIRQINADVPEWLEAIIETLLAKNPDDRFQSAEEVADLLGRHLSYLQNPGAVPQPRPIRRITVDRDASPLQKPSPGTHWNERASKERWGWILTAGLVTALIVLAALAGGVWIYLETNHGIVVFESPVDDLEIERVKKGQVARVYDTLHGGGTRWHVPVGEWEFRIRGAGQDYRIHPNRIRVTRGDRFTIRILPRKPDELAAEFTELRRLEGHAGVVTGMAFLPDGRQALSISENELRLWEVATGRAIRRFGTMASGKPMVSLAVSPDGGRALVGHGDGQVRLWNIATGALIQELPKHPYRVDAVAWTDDGRLAVAGCARHYAEGDPQPLQVYDATTWEVLRELNCGADVYSAAALPDAPRVVVGVTGGIQVWNVETGVKLAELPCNASQIRGLDVDSAGRYVLTGDNTGRVRLWDLEQERELRTVGNHDGPVHSVRFVPGTNLVVAGGWDKTLRLWNRDNGSLIARVTMPTQSVQYLAVSPAGRFILTGGGRDVRNQQYRDDGDYALRLWRLPESVRPTVEPDGVSITEVRRFGDLHTRPLADISLVPSTEGRLVATASYDGTVRIWDIETGQEAGPFLHHEEANLGSVAASPDGKTIAAGDHTGTVHLWDAENGNVRRTLAAGSGFVYDLAFSHDGARLYVGTAHYGEKVSGSVVVYDAASWEQLREFEAVEQAVHSVAPLANDARVLAGGEYRMGGVWDSETGRMLTRFRDLPTHAYALAPSPDGELAAMGFPVTKLRDERFDDPDAPGIWLCDIETGRLVRKLHGHTGNVTALAWSADGRFLVSSSGGRHMGKGFFPAWDNTLRVWDVEKGAEIARVEVNTGAGVRSLVLLPDGRHVVTAGGDEGKPDLRLWRLPETVWPKDEHKITEVRRFGELHTRPLADVAVMPSAEGRLVATASYDGTARVWDVDTGREAGPFLDIGEANPKSMGAAPDGKMIAVGDHEGTIYLWNAEKGELSLRITLGAGLVNDLAFSPDGARLYAGMGQYPNRIGSGAVLVFDVASGKRLCELEGADDFGQIVAPLPDGVRVLAAAHPNQAHHAGVWDSQTGRLLRPFHDLPQVPYSLAASPDGRLAAIGFSVVERRDEGRESPDAPGIWLYSVETGRVVRKLAGHTGNVNDLAFTGDGRFLVSGSGGHHTREGFVQSWDNTLRVWNVEIGAEIARAELDTEWGVWRLALLPDGRHVVTASGDNGNGATGDPDLRLWRLPEAVWPKTETGDSPMSELRRLEGHTNHVTSLAFGLSAERLLSASADGTVRLWNTATGQVERTLPGRHQHLEVVAALRPDGRQAATCDRDGKLRLWDFATGEAETIDAHEEGILLLSAVEYSPHGRRVLTAGKDHAARMWNSDTGERLGEFNQHGGWITGAAFSLNGRLAATSSHDHTARVWDAETFEEKQVFEHSDLVMAVAFAPDGQRLATACRDRVIRVFRVASGEPLLELHGHTDRPRDVAFSPDGRFLASCAWDATLRLWDAATGRQVAVARDERRVFNVLAFSPDGRCLASAGGVWKPQEEVNEWVPENDYAIRLWRLPATVGPATETPK